VHDSYRYCGAAAAKTENNRIWVPKLGWLSFRCSRPWRGVVKSITISRKAKRWYVSLQCAVEVPETPPRQDPWVGIDVGIAQYAAISTGQMYPSIKAFQTNERILARLQRRLARQKKKSNRWCKTKDRIAALQHHIANKRKDHAHKVSSDLVKNHGRVRMEDLRVQNMMASAKGTEKKPGKNVAQKTGLNRHLADQGLRQLRSFVEYKLAWSNGSFEAINPAYTSQTCHVCKHVAKANRLTQANFKCVACGHSDHADLNAAKNIRDTAGGVPRKERAVRRRRRPAGDPHTTEVA
jgi:putative transposase